MPVYSYKMVNNLEAALSALATMFFSKMPLELTPDEFIAAFINPEHIEKLNDVEKLVGYVGRSVVNCNLSSNGPERLPVSITFGVRAPIILPQYVDGGIQPTCPDDVRDKITSWVTERVRFGDAFGDTLDAIRELNALCNDVNTMSTLLPCLPLVMSSISDDEDAKTNKRAQSLANNKKVGTVPRILRETKNRLIEISSIVNSASLLRDAPVPEAPKFHAHANRYGWKEIERPARTHIFDVGSPMQSSRRATFI